MAERGAPLPLASLVRTFGPDLWRHRRRLSLSYGLSLAAVGATLLAPWPLKLVIDHVLVGEPLPSAVGARLGRWSPVELVAGLAAAYLLVTVLRVLATTGQRLLDTRVRERLALEVRGRVLAHVQMLPPTLAARHRSGELVHRLVADAQVFVRCLTKTLPRVFTHAASVLLTLAAMFWLAPLLGLVGIAALPLLVVVAHRYGRGLSFASREKRSREGRLAGVGQEVLRGLPSLQASGELGDAGRRFKRAAADAQGASVREARVALGMERTLQIVQGAIVSLVTGLGAWLVLQGSLSVGALTVFVSYVTQLLKPVEKINELASALSRGAAGGERLLALLEEVPAVREQQGAVAPSGTRARIALRDVWFSYPGADAGRAPVLRGASAAFEPGELAVITGRSGCGKSTLLRLLVRLFDPDRGEIRLNDHPLPGLALGPLRAQVAMLSQRPHLFAGTLRKALAREDEGAPDGRLWQALEQVDLAAFVRALPRGLDTPLGEDGIDLSGGQRQRLALARAFVLDRPILLLDEPTASVDAESEVAIVGAIERLRPGRTCVAVTHRPALLECADAVYRLEAGRLERLERSGSRPAAPLVRATA